MMIYSKKFKQKDDKAQIICLKIQVRKSFFLKKIFALCLSFLRKFAYAFFARSDDLVGLNLKSTL